LQFILFSSFLSPYLQLDACVNLFIFLERHLQLFMCFVQGVLEAVRISLAGYPTRRTYFEFVDRFGLLALELMDGK
jgi:hypothetical protein